MAMHEPFTPRLESSPTTPHLAAQAAGVVPRPNRRGARRQRRGRQPGGDPRPRRGRRGAPASPSAWVLAPLDGRATCPLTHTPPAGTCRLWVSAGRVDPPADRRGDSPGVWRHRPSSACRPCVPRHPVGSTNTRAACLPARRSDECPLPAEDLARPQQGAQAQPQCLVCIDASG
jgi:hypothetical protein